MPFDCFVTCAQVKPMSAHKRELLATWGFRDDAHVCHVVPPSISWWASLGFFRRSIRWQKLVSSRRPRRSCWITPGAATRPWTNRRTPKSRRWRRLTSCCRSPIGSETESRAACRTSAMQLSVLCLLLWRKFKTVNHWVSILFRICDKLLDLSSRFGSSQRIQHAVSEEVLFVFYAWGQRPEW